MDPRRLFKAMAILGPVWSQLTTPGAITAPILHFCRTLSEEAPFFIACDPEPWSRQLCCDMNVEEFIRKTGEGRSLYGYRIWASGTDYVEAESHVIWHNPQERKYRDVSFCDSGEDRILFLPISSSFSGDFDDITKKVRHAFTPNLAKALKTVEEMTPRHPIGQMPPQMAWEMVPSYEQWKAGHRMP